MKSKFEENDETFVEVNEITTIGAYDEWPDFDVVGAKPVELNIRYLTENGLRERVLRVIGAREQARSLN